MVVLRPLPSKPMMPSPMPPSPVASATATSAPLVSARAVSLSTRAGTRTAVLRPGATGVQRSSRTARRYRSVATRVSVSSLISIRMPVRAGSVSSRPAAIATWLMAEAKVSAPMVPVVSGMPGSVGYSSVGSSISVNVALPHLTVVLVPSVVRSTGRAGSERTISASSLPETRTVPGSSAWTGIVDWAETS